MGSNPTDDALLGSTPIDVGSALFSLHDPHRGFERAFNRYYERDHMYGAALLAPFTISGQRWVATRDLKALRRPDVGPLGPLGPFGPVAAGSYLTMFWIQAEHLDSQQRWVSEQMRSLVAAGRTFDERSVQTATAYDLVGSYRRDPDGVPPFMALDHRYPGCAWLIVERDPAMTIEMFSSHLLDELLPKSVASTPVALATAFTPRPKEPWWPAAAPEVEGVGARLAIAAFIEDDPRVVWDDVFVPLVQAIDASGHGRTLLAAPFIPTKPGTDAYVDQLW
jgi:hypothetical protein